jgi:hypothetical protein
MSAKVELSTAAAPIIHSQLVLPRHDARLSALVEDCENLWVRVNRICDQYMPKLFESSFHPS